MHRIEPKPIVLKDFPKAKRSDIYLPLYQDAAGQPLNVPFVVARGSNPGPVLGITAAVHGNELNGIKIIQDLLRQLDLQQLSGAILCAPVVNVPGYNAGLRLFSDGLDLNHQFPGKSDGKPSEQYACVFSETFLPCCDYLIDLHTASTGRTNTMYVRADLDSSETRTMAEYINPHIILHARGGDGTLRNAARVRNIPAITIEAGNPSVFQDKMVQEAVGGIRNVLSKLGICKGEAVVSREAIICKTSKWLRTTGGGILERKFKLLERVNKSQLLAETIDPFGNRLQSYFAPYSGIVIGLAANPVAFPGTRFCHLGDVGEPDSFSDSDLKG